MKKLFSVLCLVFAVSAQLIGQTFTDSNLPIVIISTDSNVGIPDQPRVLANMKIIYKGEGVRNNVTDQNDNSALNYNGRIEIEVRGSSSQFLNKKQYSFSTLLPDNVSNNNVSLLGMPKENDWILNGLAFDPSFIRDYISYTLSRSIGEYAPRTEYCEVIINGDYRGLYILQEKIKADDNRVDIIKIKTTDNTLPDLSGGYITKADKVADQDVPAWSMSSYYGTNDVNFIHEMPKSTTVTYQQNNYIKSWFDNLSSDAQAGNTSFSDGYPSDIDVPSFIDFMLIDELSANVDAYQFSTFFHKDRNGKLRAGPIFDVNLSYGNDLFLWGLDRSKTYQWQFDNGDNIGARFWKDLFNNSQYKCYMARRWHELTQSGQPLNLESIKTLIDETIATISEASVREKARWEANDSRANWNTSLDLATQVNDIKNFLDARITWMTSNLGSFSACSNVQTPPLVITRIMYHPVTSAEFPDSNDQEFIEITNNGNEAVPLAGIYFSGTGFVYQFTAGLVLQPHDVFQLANKRETFKQLHGFSPFGEFTRNLSNTGQKLTLADGFGNVIDQVEYSSQAPWPEADGNGNYLKLMDPNLDNAVATNWVASNEAIETNVITGIEAASNLNLDLYPNPVETMVRITTDTRITSVQLRDIQGRMLETIQTNSNSPTLNMSHYASGVYLLTITTNDKSVVRKVVKK